ncbi:hypothetical protein BRADI_1g22131v3 [Brachypodium distachyon]|uniref:Uncharacterized protein n=1 Tax=Brachypodium distachyon TaxID=15368 RepID=A0A0Q3GXW8_BRADI|nr:hypothetical protein BRADI_1g22131v3 [Brachypodium distachyon]
MGANPPNIEFRRTIIGASLTAWEDLFDKLATAHLLDQPDSFSWRLSTSKVFCVKLFCKSVINSYCEFRHKILWKLKVLLNLRFFLGTIVEELFSQKRTLQREIGIATKDVFFVIK